MNRDIFYREIRTAPFGGSLSQPQVNGINAILDEWDRRKLGDIRWLAYMLATTFHETARQMQPIAEFGGASQRYAPYYGRGFVQLTWLANYEKASKLLGVDLVANPDRALLLPNATTILFQGMIDGWFTLRKLADYINAAGCDYVNARRIINGTDRAALIAGYAGELQKALAAAGASVILPSAPQKTPDDPGVAPTPAKPGKNAAIGAAIGAAIVGGGAVAQSAGAPWWWVPIALVIGAALTVIAIVAIQMRKQAKAAVISPAVSVPKPVAVPPVINPKA